MTMTWMSTKYVQQSPGVSQRDESVIHLGDALGTSSKQNALQDSIICHRYVRLSHLDQN